MDDKKADNKKKLSSEKEIKELEELKESDETKKQIEEFKHKYLRALADYQNFEKRVQDEKEEVVKNANAHLILKLLPFLDSLDKAEAFVKDEGLKLVKNQFQKSLQEIELEEIQVFGKEFDPYTAEVVDIVEGGKENIVVEVLRKGYQFNGKVLRVAQVKVTKKAPNPKSQEPNNN